MNDDNQINPCPERSCVGTEDRPELPFQAISHDSALEASPRPQADPGLPLVVRERSDGERRPFCPRPSSIDGVNGVCPFQAGRVGGRRGDGGASQEGISCQRPFRRRRLSTLPPPLELIRLRNPCVLARFKFDLLRRCFFIIADSIRCSLTKSRENSLERIRESCYNAS